MLHEDICKKFESMFPQYSRYIVDWFLNGKDSVRIRLSTGSDFILTYRDWMYWRFETVESFIDGMKGGRTMNVGLHDNLHEGK